MALIVSPPALARPMTLALDACAWRRNDEKSALGMDDAPSPRTFPPLLKYNRFRVALEGMAEGIVSG